MYRLSLHRNSKHEIPGRKLHWRVIAGCKRKKHFGRPDLYRVHVRTYHGVLNKTEARIEIVNHDTTAQAPTSETTQVTEGPLAEGHRSREYREGFAAGMTHASSRSTDLQGWANLPADAGNGGFSTSASGFDSHGGNDVMDTSMYLGGGGMNFVDDTFLSHYDSTELLDGSDVNVATAATNDGGINQYNDVWDEMIDTFLF